MTSASAGSPVATIVITTHNRPDLAPRAVRSALTQTIRHIDIVVVDDGSEPAFVPELDDERLRVIRSPRAVGVSTARNLGLAAARGAWITFLDDDDVLAPDMLQRSLAAAKQSDLPSPVAVMSAVVVVGLDGQDADVFVPSAELRRGEHYFLERRGDAGRAANSLVVPTAVMRSIGGFDEELGAFVHDDLGLRLNAVASIQGISDTLYRMTTHRAPRVSKQVAVLPHSMEHTLAKHAAAFGQHRAAHAHFMAATGLYHLKAGSWRDAVRWCLRALRRDPAQPRVWRFAAAALAGPTARGVYHRVRRPESGVSFATLTGRRVRKYWHRFGDYPRALLVAPLARVARTMVRLRRTMAHTKDPEAVLLLCVYRERNAAYVATLVDEARSLGWDTRLWALDQVAPALAAQTIGTSGGAKFPLLNELAGGHELGRYEWIVVADDDFAFRTGSIRELLAVAETADLDLVQPAHTELSHRDHDFTVRRPLAVARRTTYVEVGPMFAVRRPWATQVIPFPAQYAMGWGLELEWLDLVDDGARLGIIDAVAIRHLAAVGRGYAKVDEGNRLRALVRARGFDSIRDVQHTIGTWRPWQARPPWQPRPAGVRVSARGDRS